MITNKQIKKDIKRVVCLKKVVDKSLKEIKILVIRIMKWKKNQS